MPPSAPPATATLPAVVVPAPANPAAGLPVVPNNGAPIEPASTPAAAVTPYAPVMTSAGPVSSIGSSNLSLFFTPNQMRALREALTQFESRPANAEPITDISLEIAPEVKKVIVEPPVYPIFYLSSIVFHTPNDWSIWVSGHKITSNKNTTTLRVLSVSQDRATFLWQPTYADAIATRHEQKLFADVTPVKNKLTRPSAYHYDPKTGNITFTLLINQSFVAAYFNTFEGMIESPTLPALPNANPGDKAANGATAAAAAPIPNAPQPMDGVLQPNQHLADDSINALVKRANAKR